MLFEKLLLNVGLVVLGLLAGIITVEVTLRLANYNPQISTDWQLKPSSRVLDTDLIMTHPKFFHPEYYSDTNDNLTIIALGDSFTIGYEMSRKESYPRLLKRFLKDSLESVIVFNAGVGDTGTDQQLRLFKKFFLPNVKPDIVIWQFHRNDIYNNIVYPNYKISADNTLIPLDARYNWAYQRLQLYSLIPLPHTLKEHSYIVNVLMHFYEGRKHDQVPENYDMDRLKQYGIDKVLLAIEEMERLSRKHSFTVYYVLIVPQDEYMIAENLDWETPDSRCPRKYDFNHGSHGQLEEILSNQETFIPLTVTGDQLAEETGLPKQTISETIFLTPPIDEAAKGCRHYNEIGYELMARKIASQILLAADE